MLEYLKYGRFVTLDYVKSIMDFLFEKDPAQFKEIEIYSNGGKLAFRVPDEVKDEAYQSLLQSNISFAMLTRELSFIFSQELCSDNVEISDLSKGGIE